MKSIKKILISVIVFAMILSIVPVSNFVQAEEEKQVSASKQVVDENTEVTELIEERTIYSKTFDNHDGTMTTEISQSPLHFEREPGVLEEIDNTLTAVDDGKIENDNNVFNVQFDEVKEVVSDGVSITEEDYKVKMNLNEMVIEDEVLEANPSEAAILDNTVTYKDVFEDITLNYTLGDDFVKEDIVIQERPEAGLPEKFTYTMSLNGLDYKVEENRIYLFDKATQDVMYEISAPYMYDSSSPADFSYGEEMISVPEEAKSFDLSLDVREEGDTLFVDLRPDKEWLNSNERIYPIVIDPTLSRFQGDNVTTDTITRSGFPTQVGGLDTEIGVGRATTNVVRSLVRFDLSSIPRASDVLSADLNLYLSSTNGSAPIDVSVHRVSKSWNESAANWTNRTSTDKWLTAGGEYSTNVLGRVNGITTIPTSMDARLFKWKIPLITVQDWVSIPSRNLGFLLKSVDENQPVYKKFYSKESTVGNQYKPKLVVTYKTSARLGLEEYWDYASHPLVGGTSYVNIGTLNNVIQYTDLSLANYGDLGLGFTRTYNSKDSEKSAFGYGWTYTGDEKLYINTLQTNIDYKDEDGTVHVFEWNGTKYLKPQGFQGELVKVSNTLYEIRHRDGHVLTFTVREDTQDTDVKVAYLTKQQDIHGNSITYTYNSLNQLTKIRTGLGDEVILSYRNGMIVKAESKGSEIIYDYNARHNLTTVSVKKNDAENTTTIYRYTNDFLTGVVDPNKNVTSFEYTDSFLNTVTEPELVDGVPSTTTYELDRNTLTARTVSGEGEETVYDLNSNYVVRGMLQGNTQTLYTLDNDYRILTEQTTVFGEDSYIKNYQYNTAGDLLKWTDSKGDVQVFTYNAAGNVLTETDSAGNKTRNVYDAKNNLISTMTPKGERTEFTYDQRGELIQMKLPSGTIQNFDTDYLNQQKKTIYTDPTNGVTTVTVQDLKGNLLSSTDGKGQTTSYRYNLKDELTQVVDSAGNVTTYTYDSNGNRISATNAAGKTTLLGYTGQNNVSKETDALANTTLYRYNADGELNQITKANGVRIGYLKDDVTSTSYITLNEAIRYTTKVEGLTNKVTNHNLFGQITTYKNSEDGLLESIDYNTPFGTTIAYAYNQTNSVSSISYRNEKLDYTRNQNGLLEAVSKNDEILVSQTYNSNSLPVAQIFSNQSSKLTQYGTDAATLKSEELRLKETSQYNKFDYTFDKNSQITRISDKQEDTDYQYDKLNQLIKESYSNGQSIEYKYDFIGNRISKKKTVNNLTQETKYTYNEANRLTAVGTQPLNYDANGNLISDEKYQYVWNAFDQLIEVRDKSGKSLVVYKYDEMGRRVFKDDKTAELYYRYDGNSNQVLFEEDEYGKIISSYTYDDNGIPLTWTYNGQTYYYLTNYRGDILAVTDATSKVVAEYTYDAWGNILSQSGSLASVNPYRYAGYRYDEETKLYYLIARYYNPEIGAFLSLDPVRGELMKPITMNGYVYANNNPVINVDPDGEFAQFIPIGIYYIYQGYRVYKSVKYIKFTVSSVANFIKTAPRVGSALKSDSYHRAASFVSLNQLKRGKIYKFKGGDGRTYVKLKTKGEVNGKKGVFEYILDSTGKVTHQLFVIGGKL
ncbi:hypothetical protein Plano_1430 [Planococcus sp. PAMC 21323]|uniref:DNRLRE domain-containing protein n=1 Tax=Planococcus sp. PAMC 21323 TaxID=1526927 RepID=UPI0005709181|nr:DNRLRE domain-containing protein [Planococcus sp. PAMC 21323]AIY05395.1 hypothetical protein Plano_1430 [Planococcus sp. PAMC 21323]